MDLLFRRSQTSGWFRSVVFNLWGKVEFDENEQKLVRRYGFDKAILIWEEEEDLLSRAIAFGIIVALPVTIGLAVCLEFAIPQIATPTMLAIMYFACALIIGYWHFHSKRQTIFVRDLMHGRYFACQSVVDLARKEAWLETVVAYLRQVMETAKHWDGTERRTIDALPKDEARQVILRGL